VSCKLSGEFSNAVPKFRLEELTVKVCEITAVPGKIVNKLNAINFRSRYFMLD